jgi:hypothetical protein
VNVVVSLIVAETASHILLVLVVNNRWNKRCRSSESRAYWSVDRQQP